MKEAYIWLLIEYLKRWYGFSKISTGVIYAQAKHETGNFSSAIFKEGNNLFGMRKPSVRKNYVSGENRGHATFSSLFDSVRDYFLRQKDFNISNRSDSEFISDTLRSGYAEDTAYKIKWENTVKSLTPPINPIIPKIATFALWLLLIYFLYRIYQNSQSKPTTKKIKLIKT